ncbi:MAG: sigma-70 family RNA polymerase sigma factor [Oscillospiraceae bacterium]|jgi:RNA polymerase sigma-70 factor (ECF subfamily)|nr:sigma-70 family RNA polymerase sigma factor [Oscillospiraceae bacterium]
MTQTASFGEEYSVEFIVNTYGNMLYKLAAAQINNKTDAYDALQDVLLKIHAIKPNWNDEEHLKAWLIRAVINKCRDYNKSVWNRRTSALDEAFHISKSDPDFELQNAVSLLPHKYRITLYLYYYEGYKIHEISKILNVGESGIKKRLVKGREMLKAYL